MLISSSQKFHFLFFENKKLEIKKITFLPFFVFITNRFKKQTKVKKTKSTHILFAFRNKQKQKKYIFSSNL